MASFKLMTQPKVRLFIIIPLLINILVFALLFYYFAQYGAAKLSFLTSHSLPSWLSWLEGILSYIKTFLLMLYLGILLTVFTILATLCANIIGAPFNGMLSEAYSTALGHKPPFVKFWPMVGKSLLREMIKFFYYLPRGILLVVCAGIFYFIPILNLTIPVLFLWFSSWMLAVQYIDYPADNDQIAFSDLLNKMKANRAVLLGFGLTFTLLCTIPIVNLFVMPAAVLGATKMWHQTIKS